MKILGGLYDNSGVAVRALGRVVRAALPQRCFFCGDGADETVCTPCAAALPRTDAGACPSCQLPSVHAQICGRCLRRPPHWRSLFAPWRYHYPVDRAVVAGKRASAFAVLNWFSQSAQFHAALDVDVVIAVPASPERLQERGYNQAELIARQISKRLCIPLDRESLVRIRDTETQYQRNWIERRANVRGAFAATRSLAGQRVLLVDDVLTTGATLNELSRTAQLAGALSVDAFVLARAQPMRRRERIAKFVEQPR
ncbi:MAG: ComF family protein [Betaproteobacteria bacterium]|nr:MAG: ComF family protein [Betaproteobacteria bacterium]